MSLEGGREGGGREGVEGRGGREGVEGRGGREGMEGGREGWREGCHDCYTIHI